MKPIFYNQQSKYGRVMFVIENGELSMSSRIAEKRFEERIPLVDLAPQISREREKFGVYSFVLLFVALMVVLQGREIIGWMGFFDEMVEFPVAAMYGWLFIITLSGILVYRAIAGFRRTEFAVLFRRRGGEPIRIAKDGSQGESFESFVAAAARCIQEAHTATEAKSVVAAPGAAADQMRRAVQDSTAWPL